MVSTKQLAKADREHRVFELFAKSLSWHLAANAVESRPEPEPDILYHGVNDSTAFELAEICASDVAVQRGQLMKTGGVSAIWTSDPTEEILHNKLIKPYQSDHPIELLCYHDGRVITPDSDIVLVIQDELKIRNEHSFQRIWYFGEESIFEISAAGDILRSISL